MRHMNYHKTTISSLTSKTPVQLREPGASKIDGSKPYGLPQVLENKLSKPYISKFPKNNSVYSTRPFQDSKNLKLAKTVEASDGKQEAVSGGKARHHTQPRVAQKSFGFTSNYHHHPSNRVRLSEAKSDIGEPKPDPKRRYFQIHPQGEAQFHPTWLISQRKLLRHHRPWFLCPSKTPRVGWKQSKYPWSWNQNHKR